MVKAGILDQEYTIFCTQWLGKTEKNTNTNFVANIE